MPWGTDHARAHLSLVRQELRGEDGRRLACDLLLVEVSAAAWADRHCVAGVL